MKSSAIRVTATLLISGTFAGAAADAFGVFKSEDRGRSWRRSDDGLPERSRINAFGSAKGILFAGTDSGVFTSIDEALSWRPAKVASAAPGRVISFASLGRRVLAGTDGNGLCVSSDGGASWTLDRAFPSPKVRSLCVHDGKVYAGTDAHGVFHSTDAGQSWTPLSTGLPRHAQVFALSAARGELFAGLYSRGLYGWDPEKRSWHKTGSVTPLALVSIEDTLIAGHNPGGISWSSDWGATWSKGMAEGSSAEFSISFPGVHSHALSNDAPVWELGSGGNLVFAGASAGIYYSQNQGRTWTLAQGGLPAGSPGIAFIVNEKFVLAGVLIKGSQSELKPPAQATSADVRGE
ncbi:MAG: hypothetical protein FJ404_07820 [Verrucomicrobia bacterium]|nr:hypothetical protein [Verrucomicrobiota bacterium]